MRAREFPWSDIWYWLICILTLVSVWGGAANALSPAIIAFLVGHATADTRLLAAPLVLGVWLVLLAVARFSGPLRASHAEIAWNTRETPSSRQLLQILGINGLIAALAGIPLLIFAANVGWPAGHIAIMAAALMAAAPGSVTAAALWQRQGSSVPRWRLMRADVNVNGALMTLTTLDGSALRLASSQHDSGRRRRVRLSGSSPRLRLFSITARRTLGRSWTSMLLTAAAVCGALAWGSPWLALGLGLAFTVAMAVAASGPWCDWVCEPRVRHGFARLGPRAQVAVLCGSALVPTAFLMCLMATLGAWFLIIHPGAVQWQLLWWPVVGAGLPLQVVAARGVAALRSATGQEGEDVLTTLEFGPIPVGVIRRLTAGWWGAAVVVTTAFISPALAAPLLAIIAATTRTRHTALAGQARDSPHRDHQ